MSLKKQLRVPHCLLPASLAARRMGVSVYLAIRYSNEQRRDSKRTGRRTRIQYKKLAQRAGMKGDNP